MKCKRIMAGLLSAAMILTGLSLPAVKTQAADKYFSEDESQVYFPGVDDRTAADQFDASFFSITGFAKEGNVGAEDRSQYIGDPDAYWVVKDEYEFLEALEGAREGYVKVIEIAGDLDLGWDALSEDAKEACSMIEPYGWDMRAQTTTNPSIIESGVSTLKLSGIHGLTIFSQGGNTVKHAEWGLEGTCSDIIIRNIKFDEMWMFHDEKDGDNKACGWTLMKLNGVKGVWIDHCTFTLGYDGNMDTENGSSNMTTSWCSYSLPADENPDVDSMIYKTVTYMEERYQMGLEKGTVYERLRNQANGDLGKIMDYFAFHDKFNLNGSGEKDFKDGVGLEDGNQRLHLTMAYNKITNIGQRFPLLRQGTVAYINCYLDNSGHKAAAAALGRSFGGGSVASARAGGTVAMDTCVFNSTGTVVGGNERFVQDANVKEEWARAFQNALNHTLVVNSKIMDNGKETYRGSSWDNNGNNAFIGSSQSAWDRYWNDGRKSIGNFGWFSHITDEDSSKYVRGIAPAEPFEITYDDKLTYGYQVLPLDDVVSTVNKYAGAYVLNEGPEFWLKTTYDASETIKTVAEKGETVPAEELTLNVENGSSLEMPVGELKQITAKVTPSHATDKTVTWTSSDSSVVEVKETGLLVAKGAGTAKITASVNGVGPVSFDVTVYRPVENIEIQGLKDGDTIYLGTKDQPAASVLLTAVVTPTDATYPKVTWRSDSPSQLKIDHNGVVTALAERPTGATITCSTQDGYYKQIRVIVEAGSAEKNTYKAFRYGDADGNGSVEVDDAIQVLKSVVKLVEIEGSQAVAANVNDSTDSDGNASVEVNDAIQILKYVVKLVDQFDVQK